jgi:hypothetical protein
MKLRQDLAAVLPRLSDEDVHKFCVFYEKYAPHLAAIATGLYDRLGPADQARFLLWFLKRWARIDLVNAVERGLYAATIERVKNEARPEVALDGVPYRLRDFSAQGFDFQLLGYDWFLGVHDVLYNQYEQGEVRLAPDDVIIDAGAFIGDTAVFFHHKLGRCQAGGGGGDRVLQRVGERVLRRVAGVASEPESAAGRDEVEVGVGAAVSGCDVVGQGLCHGQVGDGLLVGGAGVVDGLVEGGTVVVGDGLSVPLRRLFLLALVLLHGDAVDGGLRLCGLRCEGRGLLAQGVGGLIVGGGLGHAGSFLG